MKIVAVVRARDEAHRIGAFCQAYEQCDAILVADGGSVDETIQIAETYPNVKVRRFEGRTQMQNGHWRNNDSHHINFLIQWAREEGADWIILDDADCRPNFFLKQEYRRILDTTTFDIVMAVRVYLWGTDQHFPTMAKPGEGHEYWEPSLWAWRTKLDLWTIDLPPAFMLRIGNEQVGDLHDSANVLDVLPPFALMHFSWDDEDRVKEKVKVYRDSGLIPGQLHPLEFAGPLEPLPWWAHE